MFGLGKKKTNINVEPESDIKKLGEIEQKIKEKTKRFAFYSEVIKNDPSKVSPELLTALEIISLWQDHNIKRQNTKGVY